MEPIKEEEMKWDNDPIADIQAYFDTVTFLEFTLLVCMFAFDHLFENNYLVIIHQLVLDEVVAEKNLGEHVNNFFSDQAKFAEAREGKQTLNWMYKGCKVVPWYSRQAVQKFVPDSAKRSYLTLVPTGSLEEFWLPLRSFDISANSKHGCGVLPTLFNKWFQSYNIILI